VVDEHVELRRERAFDRLGITNVGGDDSVSADDVDADDGRALERSSCSSRARRCASTTFWSESREITVE